MLHAHRCHCSAVFLLTGIACGTVELEASTDSLSGSAGLVAAPDGECLYLAEPNSRGIAIFRVAAGRVEQTLGTTSVPTGIAISPDGGRVYVTCGGPGGAIDVFGTAKGERVATWRLGHTPMAPVMSADGRRLYVCERFDNDVAVIDAESGEILARIAVGREPVAAAVTPDGRWLIVANHLPAGPSDGAYAAASVSIVDATAMRLTQPIALPNGSTALRGVCVSSDGRYAYVTHILARYALPTTQLGRGWMCTNALSVIDVAAASLLNTVLLDDVDRGGANPWGVVCSGDGRTLYVTHAGTNEVSIIDRVALHAKLERAAAGERVSTASASAADVPSDLTFLHGIRRRVPLSGVGPRGVVAVGRRVYIAEYFSRSLGVIEVPTAGGPLVSSLPLGPAGPATLVQRGEALFNDATVCLQQWQSCASCHPDGRTDALNWDLLNDGIGNAKNTKSLLKSTETPPVMSLGVRSDASAAVRAGLQHILQTVRPARDVKALHAYLESLSPVLSPRLQGGRLSESAEKGRAVFASAGCGECHAGPLYTDGKLYDVGTDERGRKLDTPTLLETWRTAPYLHDGRAAGMEDVIGPCNPDDKHGRTSGLSSEERAALVAYLLSL